MGGALDLWLRFIWESVIKIIEMSFNDISPRGKLDKSFHFIFEFKHLIMPAGRNMFETEKSTLFSNILADGCVPRKWTEI